MDDINNVVSFSSGIYLANTPCKQCKVVLPVDPAPLTLPMSNAPAGQEISLDGDEGGEASDLHISAHAHPETHMS